MPEELTFTNWLLKQQRRRSPVGDLARDVAQDDDWPEGPAGLSVYVEYMQDCGAIPGAIGALRTAWASWKQASRRREREICKLLTWSGGSAAATPAERPAAE